MADSYPSVGLRIDLAELIAGIEKYRETEVAIGGVGEAAAKTASQVDGANVKMTAGLRSRMSLTKQANLEEIAGTQQILGAYDSSTAQILALKMRLARQQAQEAAGASAAEIRAAEASAAGQERAFTYLQGLKIRYFAQQQAEQERTDAAAIRSAEIAAAAQARVEEQNASYLQGVKRRYFSQVQRDEEAASAATRRIAEADNAFLQKLQDRIITHTKTTSGQQELFAAQAAARGLSAEAAPLIAGMEGVANSLGHASGQAIKVREAFVLIREFIRGDFSRMAGSVSILAGAFGALAPAVLPFTLALLGVGVVVAAVIAAMVKMENESDRLRNALLVTNDAVGLTSANIMAMAKTLSGDANISMSAAVSTLTKLAATGEVSGTSLRLVGDAAARLSVLTGQSADKIGGELLKSFDDASKGAVELNSHYHFLTLQEYEQIDALQKAGDKQAAFNTLMSDLDTHLQTVTPQVGTFARVWHQVTDAIDGAVRAIGRVGVAQDNQAKLESDQAKVAAYDKNPFTRNSDQAIATRARLATELATAADQQRSAYDQAQRDKLQGDGIGAAEANNAMDKRLKGNSVLIDQAITDYVKNNQARLLANPQDSVAQDDRDHMSERIARIKKLMGEPGGRRGGSLDGARNTQAGQEGAIGGLRAEIFAAGDQDPLSLMVAQVEKARAVAEGQYSNGKKTALQQQAIENAGNKEALTLLSAVSIAIGKRTKAEQERLAVAAIQRQADNDAFAAMENYYQGTDHNLTTYLRTLDQVSDVQLKAKNDEVAYTVAQQFGVSMVGEISDALVRRKLATKDVADQIQALAGVEVAQTQKTNAQIDADNREAEAKKRLITAQAAYATSITASDRLREDSGLTPAERAASSYVDVAAAVLLNTEYAKRVGLTDEQARAQVRVEQVMRKQIDDLQQMKQGIEDSIRTTFIDTGKLDFKSLKDGVSKAIRQAVYDALLAKPITIVVNAVMDVVTQGLKDQIAGIMSSITGGGAPGSGGGGLLSSIASLFGQGGASGLRNDDYSGIAAQAAQTASSVSKLSGAVSTIGTVFAAYAIGQTVTSAFGQKTTTGGQVLGAAGAVIGEIVGGPIGSAIGSVIGSAIGNLFKGGKASNFGAIATFSPDGGYALSGDKANADTTKLATAAATAVQNSVAALVAAGITPTNSVKSIDIGTRDPATINLSDGTTLHSGAIGDAAAAANVAMLAVLKTATFANEAEQKFVQGLEDTGAAFDAIIAQIQKYTEAQKFGSDISRQILKYTDPQAYAVANLQDTQKARSDQLAAYGAAGYLSPTQLAAFNAQIKILNGLELADTLKQFANGVNGATHTLADFVSEQAKILTFSAGLSTGALSPLSPQAQLALNASNFSAQSALARGGNFDALSGITNTASTYLGSAQKYYGSTQAYSDIFNSVQSTLNDLGSQTFADPMQTALASLSTAVTDGSTSVVAAVNAGTAAVVDALAASTEARVTTVATSIDSIVQANLAAAGTSVALAGGVIGGGGGGGGGFGMLQSA
jgi:hypothetical protein